MTTPTTAKEFVLPLENKPGTLAEVAGALGKANVNIVGYLLEAQGDFGVLRVIPADPAKAEAWLKQANRVYRTNEVIIAPVQEKPGELGRVAAALAKSGVNVTAAYPAETGLAFAVSDLAGAKKALGG